MTAASLSISFEGVSRTFGNVHALNPTDLHINAGEFVTLLGPSGSGKTTLLNVAAGYLSPTSGRIKIGPRDITGLPARARNIGMMFQNYALFPHMNVFENVAYGLRARRLPSSEINRRVLALLEMVRLENYGGRMIQQLSGGQQQRVALARALVIEPDVLLMDEPLGALDRQLRQHVQLEIRRLHRQHGRTTICVTHDQDEAIVMSDRIGIMRNGSIVQIGTAPELYRHPRNKFVAEFLGQSNLLPGRVTMLQDGHATLQLDQLGQEVTGQAAEGVTLGGPGLALIRPEAIRLGSEGMPVKIIDKVFLGELQDLRLELANGQVLCCRQIASDRASSSQTLGITWEQDAIRILSHEA